MWPDGDITESRHLRVPKKNHDIYMCWQKCSKSVMIDLMMINCQNTVHCLFCYFLMAILFFQADLFSHFTLFFPAPHCVITIPSNDSMGHDFSALSLIFVTGSGNIWKPGGQPTKWRLLWQSTKERQVFITFYTTVDGWVETSFRLNSNHFYASVFVAALVATTS